MTVTEEMKKAEKKSDESSGAYGPYGKRPV